MKLLSIIIPALNEAQMLPETLRTLTAVRAGLDVHSEVIVVDNDSDDATAAVATAAHAIVVQETKLQTPAAARNRGVKASWARNPDDWLLFMDADTSPDAELFSDMLNAIRSGRYLMGSCLVRGDGAGGFGRSLWNAIAVRRKRVTGGFLFIQAATFLQVGGFNPQIVQGEEQELAEKLPPEKRIVLTAHPLLLRSRYPQAA